MNFTEKMLKPERMAFHSMLQMILLVWLVKASSLRASVPEVRECVERCGEVRLYYPFGMSKGCYFNEGFQVTCLPDSSGALKPFLKGLNLPVQRINRVRLSVLIKVPVFSANCINISGEPVDLSGTPFAFSQTGNIFAAIGCDNFAKMMNQNNSIIGGCLSICTDDTNQTADSCYGVNCCEIPVPPKLKFLNASISNITSQPQQCRSAFIVEPNWFYSKYRQPGALKAELDQNNQHVPAVLDWGRHVGYCYEISSSSQPACFGRYPYRRCSIPLSESFACLCNDVYANSEFTIKECKGDLICLNSTSGYNCSNCPEGYYNKDKTPLCVPKYRRFNKNSKVNAVIIGCSAGLGTLFLVIGAWGLYKVIKRRKEIKLKKKFFKRNGGLLLQQQLSSNEDNIEKTMLFTSKELELATDKYNANRILGQGGQGTVYKGMLSDGRIVAIKKSKLVDKDNLEHFINEVVILTKINHRNVVKLLGCCLETEVPLLVYEFVPNGTLSQYIHDQIEEFPLTWEMRLRIAVEVADALSYLHSAASIPIYHRDIKSANILLDDKYRARVSDFGTSRSVAIDQTHLTTQVQGTFGYLDPEFFRSSQFTEKSDVYSFGVVLVELLTGEKPIRLIETEEDRSLVVYFLQALKENRLFEVLDARVIQEGRKEEIVTVATLAKRCLNLNGKKRPTMREVAVQLMGIRSPNGASILQQSFEENDSVDAEVNEYFEVGDGTSFGSAS